jgi:hypothetical protein
MLAIETYINVLLRERKLDRFRPKKYRERSQISGALP